MLNYVSCMIYGCTYSSPRKHTVCVSVHTYHWTAWSRSYVTASTHSVLECFFLAKTWKSKCKRRHPVRNLVNISPSVLELCDDLCICLFGKTKVVGKTFCLALNLSFVFLCFSFETFLLRKIWYLSHSAGDASRNVSSYPLRLRDFNHNWNAPINFILSYSTKFHTNSFNDSLTITCRQSDGYMANVIGLLLFFISNASKAS
jgi:hypothetical protein